MKKILFVEDDKEYRDAIVAVLENSGYEVDAVEYPVDAMELFALGQYDLVISDLMLDEIDGIRFLSYIKKLDSVIKTMILTAEPSMDTELEALNIYVDKYLVKETRIDVLLKHIELLMNQGSLEIPSHQKVIRSREENLILDALGRRVQKNGVEVSLTPKEFDVLKLLMQNSGRALSRDEMIKHIWDKEHEEVDERVIDVHVKKIRQKLKLQSIVSVRGFGYKWDN